MGLTCTQQLTRTSHHLAPGDTLLTYTDGITERRGPTGLYGPERLHAAAALHAAAPSDLVAGIRTALSN